ncbi:LapA family protein [Qingshengfaniella alkalisoli]|uniref:LapA family protein n=1 Tax=Qingshengfaniella alkalisoli TaxID=2599296 RepID=A0A5B8IVY6_9RHOB|nr:LapA family protein [Qingshengfaniella alkalisoli]QDY68668.1 LapA family protein [Qingshengfaniella alkalisoli]
MRYIKWAFLALLALCLITVGFANREVVNLQLLPEDIAVFAGISAGVSMPLYLIVFASVIAGLLIGFVWEWLREHKHRSVASSSRKEKAALESELRELKTGSRDTNDDVLALLETPKSAR